MYAPPSKAARNRPDRRTWHTPTPHKSREGKNSDIFSNFVLNANKNNIKKLFTTEVLQKNNYYIGGMNKKGKFIFKILENNFNELFDEDDFYFEDYLLLIFTGYYTENILSSSYGA